MAKVMCIDDDQDVLETCAYFLKEEGHTVETAMSAKDGVERSKAFQPDIILLDVMMEDSTAGFHAAYNFRQDDKLRYVPILMLTSVNQKLNTNFHPDTDGEFLPVDDFIEKPIIRDRLMSSVRKLLDLSKEQINVSGRNKVI